jgi:hypothetical protein
LSPGQCSTNEDCSQIAEVIEMQMAEKDLVEAPISKRNLSPLPSSTRKQAAAWLGRAVGMPVPHAMTRISFGLRSSLFGK